MSRISWKACGLLALGAGLAGHPATLGWLDAGAQAQVATRIKAPPRANAQADAPAPQFPRVWMGVRLTPLPEAVAAQLQRDGLMIANVAEDSPADKAGFDRYDVLVSLDGRPVQTMDDVKAALDGAAGREIEAVVLRSGDEKRLKLTPSEEQPQTPVRFRYEEPEVPAAEPFANFYGGRLKLDPQGGWLVEPLGPMTGFDELWEQLSNGRPGLLPDDPTLTPQMWPDDAFVFNLDDDVDIDATFSVTEVRNGATLSVQRGRDGSVTVERTDASGHRTEARYENMDQLKQQDQEAHELVQRRFGMRISPRVVNPGGAQDLLEAQRDFERRLEEQLEQARQRTRAMIERLKSGGPGAPGAIAQPAPRGDGRTELKFDLRREADGGFRIQVQRGSEVETHEFKSLDELKQKAPRLFDELKQALDKLSHAGGHAVAAA